MHFRQLRNQNLITTDVPTPSLQLRCVSIVSVYMSVRLQVLVYDWRKVPESDAWSVHERLCFMITIRSVTELH